MHSTRWVTLLLILLTSFTVHAQQIGKDAEQTGKDPVIIIPGVQGSEILDSRDKTLWFGFRRGKHDDLRLPINSTVLSRNHDSLHAGDILRKVDLKLLPDITVYQALTDALESRGYHEATWN